MGLWLEGDGFLCVTLSSGWLGDKNNLEVTPILLLEVACACALPCYRWFFDFY